MLLLLSFHYTFAKGIPACHKIVLFFVGIEHNRTLAH